MRLVFAGSSSFSLPVLRALAETAHRPLLVLTPPDRPGSRGGQAARPVLELARELALPVAQPERLGLGWWRGATAELEPQALVVAAYGLMVGERILESLQFGGVGVHPSLLPRHRGASPVAATILAGDSVSGVSIFQMRKALDSGPVLTQQPWRVEERATTPRLTEQLAELAASALPGVLDRLERGDAESRLQDESAATYCSRLRRQDGELEWRLETREIDRRVRALAPWPGTTVPLAGAVVKLIAGEPSRLPESSVKARAGEILGECSGGVLLRTQDGAFCCQTVQPPGGRQMPTADYLRGRRIRIPRP